VDVHIVVGVKAAAGGIGVKDADLDHGFPLGQVRLSALSEVV
jgi:hypothetical protein